MCKNKKSLFLVFAAMLCLFLVCGKQKIISHAATGDLTYGTKFNETIKSFTNDEFNAKYKKDETIKKIIFAKEPAKPVNELQQKSVGEGVTAYYDTQEKTVYICCKSAPIRFNEDCTDMFKSLTAVETIDFGKGIIDTRNIVNGRLLFYDCENIEELDLGQFRTPNLTNMYGMFGVCMRLKKLNVSTLDTSNVTNMATLFANTSLETLDISNFKTSNVKLMERMFCACSKLKNLNLSNFDTSNVTDMSYMFYKDKALESLNLSNFNTSKVEKVNNMFENCENIKFIDLSNFDLTKVSENNGRFFLTYCYSLQYIDGPCKINRKFQYDPATEIQPDISVGKVALDDNKDGKPDSDDRYDYFPETTSIHRYLFIDNIEKMEKEREIAEAAGHSPFSITVCIILFDANGGSGAMDPRLAELGTDYILPECTFIAPEGKEFDQWDKGEAGSRVKITRGITLKALWKDKVESGVKSLSQKNLTDKEKDAPVSNESEKVAAKNVDSKLKNTKISKITAKKNSVVITWKKQTRGGIKGYEIQYSSDKNFGKDVKSVTVTKAKTTSKTIKKLKVGKKYYFRIRTYKKSGSEKIYSNWSKTKNIKVK